MPTPWLIAVMGPTASGKSELAEALADKLGARLVNADAFQIYRGMDIGTSKPDQKDRYELLDLKLPNQGFGVGEWLPLAHEKLEHAFRENQSVLVVGGTGLYIRALFEEYSEMSELPDPVLRSELEARIANDGLAALYAELKERAPEVAMKVDPKNPTRVRRALERLEKPSHLEIKRLPAFQKAKLAIECDKNELIEKIEYRIKRMMQNGWLEEVEGLRTSGYGPGDPGFRALGYSALWQHLAGTLALDEALETIERDTRRYAKRQRSWLRSEPNTIAIQAERETDLLNVALQKLAI